MLERFSIAVAGATILAVLAKLAHLQQESKTDWFDGSVTTAHQYYILIGFFLIFLRGKMMHDDAHFFREIEDDYKTQWPTTFKKNMRWLVKIGLLCGYFSWLLWAPAIYYLEQPPQIAVLLILSLGLSTVWLLVDIFTRIKFEWRRAFWIVPNAAYASLLALMKEPSPGIAFLLLLVLFADWLFSDPMWGHVGA